MVVKKSTESKLKIKKCWHQLLYAHIISFIVKRKCEKIQESDESNIGEENFHIFWTNWETSIRFSWKTWLIITLIVTKKQGFTLCP